MLNNDTLFSSWCAGEGGCFDHQAFYDTIEESADKLWIHTNDLADKCLGRGEAKGMLAVLGSIALTRNKLWLYNEQMTLNDKPKPLAKTYAKWVEFTDAMAQQVPSDENKKYLNVPKNIWFVQGA